MLPHPCCLCWSALVDPGAPACRGIYFTIRSVVSLFSSILTLIADHVTLLVRIPRYEYSVCCCILHSYLPGRYQRKVLPISAASAAPLKGPIRGSMKHVRESSSSSVSRTGCSCCYILTKPLRTRIQNHARYVEFRCLANSIIHIIVYVH